MKTRQLLSLFSVFLLSLVITVSCANPQQTTTSSKTETIQMGFSVWPGWLPWQVAQEEKLFEANKVNVNLKWFDGYLDSINALNAGQLSANTQTLNDTISSVAAGSDQVIILVNDNSTGNDKIIVREGINSIADLKGKKIAAEEGTVDHFLLLLGLKKAGLTQADITFQPLETGAAAAAFVAGQVDAVGVFAPFTSKALERAGSKELFSSKDFPGAIPDHLTVSRKLINERPQDVQALVNTWFDTLAFIRSNPDKAYATMAKRAGVAVDEYKKYEAGTKIFSIENNLKAFSPGNDMASLGYAAQEISKFLIKAKLTKQTPNLSQIFDDQFIKAYAAKQKS
ncbi:ABC transporter substrate-binding protein [Coleofasciculus sp. H7-2]|uniref:ABC transporter substrate-binding protein n=1 Tax=Coleofasciculus sp. H7-2 TaxID=3351545 RepID=UPI003671ED87